jgi:hypothetical protein
MRGPAFIIAASSAVLLALTLQFRVDPRPASELGRAPDHACVEGWTPFVLNNVAVCARDAEDRFDGTTGQVPPNLSRLFWPEDALVALAAGFPHGTLSIDVTAGPYEHPSEAERRPSEVEGMDLVGEGRLAVLVPRDLTLNGQPVSMRCHPSLNPQAAEQGAYECHLQSALGPALSVRISLRTVTWRDAPAWPPHNERASETWPAFLATVEDALPNLIQFSQ